MRSSEPELCLGGDGHVGYRVLPGRCIELGPDACPRGHRLQSPNVSVSYGAGHRSYLCWTCHRASLDHARLYYCLCRIDRVLAGETDIPVDPTPCAPDVSRP